MTKCRSCGELVDVVCNLETLELHTLTQKGVGDMSQKEKKLRLKYADDMKCSTNNSKINTLKMTL